jgi:hypothetical protein
MAFRVHQDNDKARILQALRPSVLPDPTREKLQSFHGTESLLDGLHRARPAGGLPAPAMVGVGRDHSDYLHLLVDRLPQRMVLNLDVGSSLGHGKRSTATASGGAGYCPGAGDHAVAEHVGVRIDGSTHRRARQSQDVASGRHNN